MGQGAGAASVEYLVHSPTIRLKYDILVVMVVVVMFMIKVGMDSDDFGSIF